MGEYSAVKLWWCQSQLGIWRQTGRIKFLCHVSSGINEFYLVNGSVLCGVLVNPRDCHSSEFLRLFEERGVEEGAVHGGGGVIC